MKKKISLWFNIATICLCLCVIVVGVYSAHKATLNVTGTVGFKAHNCNVYVYGTVTGAVDSAGVDLTNIKFGEVGNYKNVHDDKTGWNMGEMYFNDLGDVPTGKNAVDIVITLKMYNTSTFDVKAIMNTDFILDAGLTGVVKISSTSPAIMLLANKSEADAQTMTIVLSLDTSNDVSKISFDNEVLVSFERNTEQKFYIGTGDDEGKLMMNMGHGTAKENATNVDLEWYAFAVKGNYNGTTATAPSGITGLTDSSYNIIVTNNTTDTSDDEVWYSLQGISMTLDNIEGHTFWFIQKYVTAGGYNNIEGVCFSKEYDSTTMYGMNNYKSEIDTSDIYTYVTGDYLEDTGIYYDAYFSLVDSRTVNEACASKNEYVSDTISFSSKLWLISSAEISLFSQEEFDLEDTNKNCEAYGIGAKSIAASWWLRSTNGKTSYGCHYIYNNNGFSGQAIVNSLKGIRAAFQIQI